MKVVVMEGILEELGPSSISNNGVVIYDRIKIGGKRYEKIVASGNLNSYLSVGTPMRLACDKALNGQHVLTAVQESDGYIKRHGILSSILAALIIFGCTLVLSAIPGIYIGVIIGFKLYFGIITGLGCVFAYLSIIGGLKARVAFDGLPPPAETFQTRDSQAAYLAKQ